MVKVYGEGVWWRCMWDIRWRSMVEVYGGGVCGVYVEVYGGEVMLVCVTCYLSLCTAVFGC